jgi:hypothetical protein
MPFAGILAPPRQIRIDLDRERFKRLRMKQPLDLFSHFNTPLLLATSTPHANRAIGAFLGIHTLLVERYVLSRQILR